MAEDSNKENITNGLFPSVSSMAAPEPRKTKKSRSLSMGPGAAVQQLKSDTDNRRKSMMPSVKSILSTAKDGKADEAAKRKAARRKSLANRRVSFAPEATLHTWDVVEYMRDATSSSASSEEARRASSVSQVEPQTPTQTLESDSEVTSPVPQSLGTMEDVLRTTDQSQQDKRKGSLGIPLASPDFESSDEEDDMGDATMDLDDEAEQNPANFRDSTSSSAKLDDALRQASVVAQANTQNFVIEDEGDQTMDMAGDEVTSAFRPFFNKNRRGSVGVRKAIPIENQENENPFKPTRDLPLENEPLSDNDSNEDATMDVTVAFGGIIKQQPATINQSELTKTSKRRRSSTNLGVESSGSPAARPVPRRSLARRRSSMEPSVMEDETMDFTIAVGGIKQVSRDTEEQDLTEASLMDQTMDFTVAVGKIRHMPQPVQPRDATENMFNTERLEDLSMELTANLGKTIAEAINNVAPSPSETQTSKSILPSVTVERHATPTKRSPATPRSATFHSLERRQSTRKSPRRNLHASLSFETPVTPEALSFPSPAVVPKIESPPRAASTPSKNTVTLPVPEQNPTAKSSISDTLRLLLTPRKEILPTPVIASQATPRRTPRRGTTPKKRAAEEERYVSPKKRVRLEVEEESPVPEPKSNMRDDQEGDPISLPDFLNMTGIRFMDLTTTKRRATGYPGADGMMFNTRDNTIEELEPSMDNKIAAAVSTVPMMSMYQHSCQEMKSYIASGRTEIKSIEAAAIAAQPPLFHDYADASFAEKAIIDNQLRDLKTNARLQSKSGWHTWRSQLLNDLKNGLLQTSEELEQDSRMLAPVENAFFEVAPILQEQEKELQSTLENLWNRKRDVEDGREADLEDARERLVSTERELQQKKAHLAKLRSEMADRSSRLEDARSWKTETVGAIKEAERVNEECRGWSTKEVLDLKDKLQSLETQLGWSLEAASRGCVTIKHKDLHLSIDPRSWLSKSNSPTPESPNTPISVVFAGPEDEESKKPSATVRRFFLQYIRAQAYTLPQFCTRITHLVALVQNAWGLASSILAAVHSLEISGQTDVQILGDEKLGIETIMFLPMLQTKVRVRFEVDVAINLDDARANGSVNISAKVVYGECYDEPKMASFLETFVSSGKVGSEEQARNWANGLNDLKDRLVRTGPKGVRRS